MQATGIEKALGGEAQAVAALQALGDTYERKLRGAEADLPKMIPAAFTGEGMSSGFMGMGMGGFLGLMTGGMLSSAVRSMSDDDLAELVKDGPIKFDNRMERPSFMLARTVRLTDRGVRGQRARTERQGEAEGEDGCLP